MHLLCRIGYLRWRTSCTFHCYPHSWYSSHLFSDSSGNCSTLLLSILRSTSKINRSIKAIYHQTIRRVYHFVKFYLKFMSSIIQIGINYLNLPLTTILIPPESNTHFAYFSPDPHSPHPLSDCLISEVGQHLRKKGGVQSEAGNYWDYGNLEWER